MPFSKKQEARDVPLLGGEAPAGAGRGDDVELAEAGSFTLTTRDMFTNELTVQVTPEMKIFEVKELLRKKKDESMDYVDGLRLLYNTQPLDDESTVGSNGLSPSDVVSLANQNMKVGRKARRERAERAAAEAAREAQARQEAVEAARARAAERSLELEKAAEGEELEKAIARAREELERLEAAAEAAAATEKASKKELRKQEVQDNDAFRCLYLGDSNLANAWYGFLGLLVVANYFADKPVPWVPFLFILLIWHMMVSFAVRVVKCVCCDGCEWKGV